MIPNKTGIILQSEVVCVIKTNNIKVNFIVEINKSKLKSHEKVCENNVFCRIVIPSENRFSKQILKKPL